MEIDTFNFFEYGVFRKAYNERKPIKTGGDVVKLFKKTAFESFRRQALELNGRTEAVGSNL